MPKIIASPKVQACDVSEGKNVFSKSLNRSNE